MGTELVNYKAQQAALAAQYARESTVSGTFITTAGGVLQLGGDMVPGNQLVAVIVDAVRENTYYVGDYDPERRSPPKCYAFGRVPDDMAPAPSMQGIDYFEPQAVACGVCPHNKWGSAEKGKGKACQNRRRLALLPAGYFTPRPKSRDFDLTLIDDPQHYATADLAYLKLPVTSCRGYDTYVQKLAANGIAPCGAVTRIYVESDPKSQYFIRFECLSVLPDEIGAVVLPRQAIAQEGLTVAYQAPDDDSPF